MMTKKLLYSAISALLLISGAPRADDDRKASKCPDCGVVTAVQEGENSGGSGLGAAAGALAGGLLGNQAGKTETASNTIGGTAATILGVAGGAIAGHYGEKAMAGSQEWNVTVKMNNGEIRTVNTKSAPTVKPGDTVRIADGAVVRYQEARTQKKSDNDDEDDDD